MKEKISLIWKHFRQGLYKNVASDIMDLSIRKTLLEIYASLYFTWTYRNRGFPHLQSDLKDLVDIITGHQTGKLVSTFIAMISFSIISILISQASSYASTFINLKVDTEIKNDIFSKMLVTDWEALTKYHTEIW